MDVGAFAIDGIILKVRPKVEMGGCKVMGWIIGLRVTLGHQYDSASIGCGVWGISKAPEAGGNNGKILWCQ